MRCALLGDLHRRYDPVDTAQLDGRGLDLVLFVGDLGDPRHARTLDVARRIARLRTPALVFPGNHDGTHPLAVFAEALGVGRRRPGAGRRGLARIDALRTALGPVPLVGFSLHPFPAHGLTVIAARPHAMDPRYVTFEDLIHARFGIRTLAESAALLRSLVDRAEGDLVFLAHNGPGGLGSGPRDPFGWYGRRDLGDPDLADAVAHARRRGRRVLAVLAGHLHHRGDDRDWQVRRDGVLYVNAARVPRWIPDGDGFLRHHVELVLGDGAARAEAILLPSEGVRW